MIAPTGTTWDDRQLPEWPERTIVEITPIDNPLGDGEPFAQHVRLDCGHWLINSHGVWFQPLALNAALRCRTCAVRGEGAPNSWQWMAKPSQTAV
jgi:hypothetical protein